MSLFGDLFHITKTAISVGDEISPIDLGDVKHNGTSIPSPVEDQDQQ